MLKRGYLVFVAVSKMEMVTQFQLADQKVWLNPVHQIVIVDIVGVINYHVYLVQMVVDYAVINILLSQSVEHLEIILQQLMLVEEQDYIVSIVQLVQNQEQVRYARVMDGDHVYMLMHVATLGRSCQHQDS